MMLRMTERLVVYGIKEKNVQDCNIAAPHMTRAVIMTGYRQYEYNNNVRWSMIRLVNSLTPKERIASTNLG